MLRGRHSDYLLGGLLALAVANGFFLGLTLYALLAAFLRLVHGHAPGLGWALVAGAAAAVLLLLASLQKERRLREGEYAAWIPIPAGPEEHPLLARLRALTKRSRLSRPPVLAWVESPERNAFTVAVSREEAAIILTAGLIRDLPAVEMDAVLATQLAHVEREDVKAVGFADALADSVEDLSRAKARFLWGPAEIARDLRPVMLVTVAGAILIALHPDSESGGVTLLFAVLALAILYAYWRAAKRSWRGLGQLFLFVSFFGPLSLVEAALAPPTAVLLSRLVSRARVHEADQRAVALTGDPAALASALRRVANVEAGPTASWLGSRRYSLFVAPSVNEARWAWLARQRATHPSVSSRLERIAELKPDPPVRAAAPPG